MFLAPKIVKNSVAKLRNTKVDMLARPPVLRYKSNAIFQDLGAANILFVFDAFFAFSDCFLA
jgi:hypothetical protein